MDTKNLFLTEYEPEKLVASLSYNHQDNSVEMNDSFADLFSHKKIYFHNGYR